MCDSQFVQPRIIYIYIFMLGSLDSDWKLSRALRNIGKDFISFRFGVGPIKINWITLFDPLFGITIIFNYAFNYSKLLNSSLVRLITDGEFNVIKYYVLKIYISKNKTICYIHFNYPRYFPIFISLSNIFISPNRDIFVLWNTFNIFSFYFLLL